MKRLLATACLLTALPAAAAPPPDPALEYDPSSQAWNGMASFVGLAEGMGFSVTPVLSLEWGDISADDILFLVFPLKRVEPQKLAEEVVVLHDEDHRYLTRVLRLDVGAVVTLFDGKSVEATARIVRIGPRALELKIDERRPVAGIDRPSVTIIQGLAKGDKIEIVVQKATELGVARVIPVTTARARWRGSTPARCARRSSA